MPLHLSPPKKCDPPGCKDILQTSDCFISNVFASTGFKKILKMLQKQVALQETPPGTHTQWAGCGNYSRLEMQKRQKEQRTQDKFDIKCHYIAANTLTLLNLWNHQPQLEDDSISRQLCSPSTSMLGPQVHMAHTPQTASRLFSWPLAKDRSRVLHFWSPRAFMD